MAFLTAISGSPKLGHLQRCQRSQIGQLARMVICPRDIMRTGDDCRLSLYATLPERSLLVSRYQKVASPTPLWLLSGQERALGGEDRRTAVAAKRSAVRGHDQPLGQRQPARWSTTAWACTIQALACFCRKQAQTCNLVCPPRALGSSGHRPTERSFAPQRLLRGDHWDAPRSTPPTTAPDAPGNTAARQTASGCSSRTSLPHN